MVGVGLQLLKFLIQLLCARLESQSPWLRNIVASGLRTSVSTVIPGYHATMLINHQIKDHL